MNAGDYGASDTVAVPNTASTSALSIEQSDRFPKEAYVGQLFILIAGNSRSMYKFSNEGWVEVTIVPKTKKLNILSAKDARVESSNRSFEQDTAKIAHILSLIQDHVAVSPVPMVCKIHLNHKDVDIIRILSNRGFTVSPSVVDIGLRSSKGIESSMLTVSWAP